MKNRIEEKFTQLKAENRRGFIPFIVAGDPNLEKTKNLLLELAKRNSAVIEPGVPFSDPVADGLTIQASAERALRNPVNVESILRLVAEIRRENCETPIILFSYFNPILQFGLDNFALKAKESGVDGVLITDLVPEEASDFRQILEAQNLALIMLAAPTSSDERLAKICAQASGFVYAVSRAGVTGTRDETSNDARNLVRRLRKFTDLPIAVGFGISSAAQILETWNYADAAIVGSAIVKEIEKYGDSENLIEKISKYLDELLPEKSAANNLQ